MPCELANPHQSRLVYLGRRVDKIDVISKNARLSRLILLTCLGTPAIQEGLRRFPNGWQADQLRRTLDRYEKATAEPVEPPTVEPVEAR